MVKSCKENEMFQDIPICLWDVEAETAASETVSGVSSVQWLGSLEQRFHCGLVLAGGQLVSIRNQWPRIAVTHINYMQS